jgi:hypothetical protein
MYDRKDSPMSALPVHRRPGPVPAIPKTIDAIAVALSAPKRMAFYAEVGQTDAAELESVIERWWTDVMLDQVPGREERLAGVMAGRNLVSIDAIAARAQEAAG